MRVLVYLCTSIYRGCSDRAKHLEIAANAPEIIVVCTATHSNQLFCGADPQKVLYL